MLTSEPPSYRCFACVSYTPCTEWEPAKEPQTAHVEEPMFREIKECLQIGLAVTEDKLRDLLVVKDPSRLQGYGINLYKNEIEKFNKLISDMNDRFSSDRPIIGDEIK